MDPVLGGYTVIAVALLIGLGALTGSRDFGW